MGDGCEAVLLNEAQDACYWMRDEVVDSCTADAGWGLYVPNNTRAALSELRARLAAASLDIMLDRTPYMLASAGASIDISTIVEVFDDALPMVGLRGMMATLLQTIPFRAAIEHEAARRGARIWTTQEPHHMQVDYWHAVGTPPAFASERASIGFLFPGSLWWLRHYLGVFLAERVLAAPVGMRSGTDPQRVRSITEFVHEVIAAQTRAGSDFLTVSVEHGGIWHAMASLYGADLDAYPQAQVDEWCGARASNAGNFYEPYWQTDLGVECRHAVGHGVYYSVARRELAWMWDFTMQLLPRKWEMSWDGQLRARRICEGARLQEQRISCIAGVEHSLGLMSPGPNFGYDPDGQWHDPDAGSRINQLAGG